MKKVTVISFLVLLCITALSCKDNAASKIDAANIEKAKERDEIISLGAAEIAFDKTEFDFGTITEGDLVEGSFKVTNSGKTDLVITNAKATCGCTVPDWPKEAIKPGESADLKFTFNSNGRTGKQSKSITLQTNTEKVTETLRIKGTVTSK